MPDALYLESGEPRDEARRRVDAAFDGPLPRFWPFGGLRRAGRRLAGRTTERPDSVAIQAIYLGWLDVLRLRPLRRSLFFGGRLIATDAGSDLLGEFHLPFWHWAANGAVAGLLAGLAAALLAGDPILLFPLCLVGALAGGAAVFGLGQIDAWVHFEAYETSGREMAAALREALGPPRQRTASARPEDGLAWTDSPVPPGAGSWGAE